MELQTKAQVESEHEKEFILNIKNKFTNQEKMRQKSPILVEITWKP